MYDDEEQQRSTTRHELTRPQKAGFLLLMLIGVAGVYLGIRSFPAYTKRPFEIQIANALKQGRYVSQDEQAQRQEAALKTRDTDGDGLTDYDELYIYKTSPFIADSDSDGFNDKTEVFSNNDPNCPKGETCAASPVENVQEAGNAAELATRPVPPVPPLLQLEAGSTAGQIMDADSVYNMLSQMDAKEVRQVLREAGVSEQVLSSKSDAEIMALMKETLAETKAKAASGTATDTTSPQPTETGTP
ncbi:hypothetical protein HYV73_00445 [Candidatus Uhrbacteria bacterium]|nr:hypothetical protein [Candidatus Uhrbacteria bacterium]